jgi:signal transduction histidine kinase
LFRICQEAINNTLKHANAKHLKISLQYSEKLFNLTLEDDGDGFSAGQPANNGGAGLKNMENRATLIGATATIGSLPGKGCIVKVLFNPLEQPLNFDGPYTNSPG